MEESKRKAKTKPISDPVVEAVEEAKAEPVHVPRSKSRPSLQCELCDALESVDLDVKAYYFNADVKPKRILCVKCYIKRNKEIFDQYK